MALDKWFGWVAAKVDGILITGINDAVAGGIIWARPMVGVALSLTVLCYAAAMMYGKRDGWSFAMITIKATTISALLIAENYNYYIRDLFFTDLPNQIARALNGPRIDVNSAQQFDVVWEGAVHYTYFVVAQASWYDSWIPRLIAGWNLFMLLICFGVWLVSRVMMSVVICLGPFIIFLALFQQTIGYVKQWGGKLFALTMLGLGSSIVMRFVFVLLTTWMKSMEMNAKMSVDELIIKVSGVAFIFSVGGIMMISLPVALSFGSAVSGAAATAAGMLGGAVATVGGAARTTVGGAVGKSLGRYTGRR